MVRMIIRNEQKRGFTTSISKTFLLVERSESTVVVAVICSASSLSDPCNLYAACEALAWLSNALVSSGRIGVLGD